ncbi:unnamed protein product, partial [Prorocentrum cordatum]
EMAEMGKDQVNSTLELEMDSAAARGVIHIRGVGRALHLQARWILQQDLVRDGEMEVAKIKNQGPSGGHWPGLSQLRLTTLRRPKVLTKVLAAVLITTQVDAN